MQRTTKFGFLRYAHEFFDAYNTIADKHEKITDLLSCKYFLLGRTLELGLKALLMNIGFDLKYIKRLGHDLQLLSSLVYIRYRELDFSIKEIAVVNVLNEYYLSKEFEYPLIGSKRLPTSEDLEMVVNKILYVADSNIHKD